MSNKKVTLNNAKYILFYFVVSILITIFDSSKEVIQPSFRKKMSRVIKFPDDFSKHPHPLGKGIQYKFDLSDGSDTLISIVFGEMFYSNGKDTYEMFDFREDEPQGYLTIDQINQHLKSNPIL